MNTFSNWFKNPWCIDCGTPLGGGTTLVKCTKCNNESPATFKAADWGGVEEDSGFCNYPRQGENPNG